MSAAQGVAPHGTAPGLDVSGTSPVPLGTLTKVEVRKAVDTRAGFWLIVSILALVVVVELIYTAAADNDLKDFSDYLQIPAGVLGYFLPILVIMLVTSEQSQRNGLVTFTLEPRRPRIVLAKLLAALALCALVMVLAFVLGGAGTALGAATGASPEWSLTRAQLLNGFVLGTTIGILVGFALATLIMNTPGAIVAYFVYTFILPTAVGILSSLSDTFERIGPWIEFNTAQIPLFTDDFSPDAEQWAQIAVSGTIWLVVPLVLGIARLLRIEFK